MSTQATALYDSSPNSRETTSSGVTELQRLFWSIRREFWENRSLYIAFLAAAGVILFGFVLGALHLAHASIVLNKNQSSPNTPPIVVPLNIAAGVFMAIMMIVSVLYCLDALYGERRDRTVLFWKSLPVSDLTTVLAKTSIPLLFLPLIAFAVTVVTQWCILLIVSASMLFQGHSPAALWTDLFLSKRWLLLFWHLFAVHSLWYAPFFGWFLLVSAWARRTPFLWAFLPPFAVIVLEKLIFNTSHFAYMLRNRLAGGSDGLTAHAPGMWPLDPSMHISLGHYLASPGLWIGFLITAIFLAAAVQLRRYRTAL